MSIAHFSIFSPNRSGMYSTTRDIVIGQKEAGIDCGFIDAMDPHPKSDGNFRTEGFKYADTADIYGLHLMVPEPYYSDGTPMAIFLHGHPFYSMQVELYGLEEGNDRPWTTIENYFGRTEKTLFVSFWEEDQKSWWDVLDGDRNRMRYARRGIYMDENMTHLGTQRDLEGSPVIVIADQFRMFKDILPVLTGAQLYCDKNPKAKIHLYGLPPTTSRERDCINRWLLASRMRYNIASLNEIVDYLPEVFRTADVLVSNVNCESRVVVEAAACGCKVVAPWEYANSYVEKPWRPDSFCNAIEKAVESKQNREQLSIETRDMFNISKTVEDLERIYNELLS